MHNIFLCKADILKDETFRVSITGTPKLSVTGDSIEECEEELGGILTEEYDEIHAVFEYKDGLPKSMYPRKLYDTRFSLINAFAGYRADNQIDLFLQFCPTCGNTSFEQRSPHPIVANLRGCKEDVLHTSSVCSPVVSRRLSDALGLEHDFIIRPIDTRGTNRREYVEIIARDAGQVAVGVAVTEEAELIVERLYGTKCKACSDVSISYLQGSKLLQVIERYSEALERDFFIIDGTLAIKNSILDTLEPTFRKRLSTTPIGVCSPEYIDRDPDVRIIGED
jgi:uncharacterized OB-fold protein